MKRIVLAATLVAACVCVFASTADAARADNYRGTHHDYSTKIVIYNDAINAVKGVRVRHHYQFSLQAFGTDTSFGFMCMEISTGTWNCRDTIAAGTIEADLYQEDALGTDFLITPNMVHGGTVTVRALDIDRTPLVTRVVPVAR